MESKWVFIVMLLQIGLTIFSSKLLANEAVKFVSKEIFQNTDAIKTIQSEDGDIIDCIDIYKQPAFDHPALRNHKIQMNPSHDVEMDPTDTKKNFVGRETDFPTMLAKQIWQKSGNCPKGTIPIRRTRKNSAMKGDKIESYERRKATVLNDDKQPNEREMWLQPNHSLAILHTEGFAYYGIKADIMVWNPQVERDDEYSLSHVSLQSGSSQSYQAIESGWAVNPGVYGDKKTRLFVYWTEDGGKETGCFDLTCPGFVQTSHEIALGAAIYPISNPHGLGSQITLMIHYDRDTGNWWVRYGDETEIGYWPSDLFETLKYHFIIAQWGGEVYSSRVGTHPHTATEMGNGRMPDVVFGNSGHMLRMRILGNNLVPRFPEWVFSYTDEYECYNARYVHDYVVDPEFYYSQRNDEENKENAMSSIKLTKIA